MPCPSCGSYNTIKNGKSSSGEQRYKCKICGRSYTASSSSGSTHKKTVSANQPAPAQNENGIYKILPSIIMITISFIILLFDSSIGWWLMGISLVVVGINGAVVSFQNQKTDSTNEKNEMSKTSDTSAKLNDSVLNDVELPLSYEDLYLDYTFDYVDVCIIKGNEPDYDALSIGDTVELVSEHDNAYDSKAVALYVNSQKIGYIYRGKIQDIANEYLDSLNTKHIEGIITDIEKPNIKINIGLYK